MTIIELEESESPPSDVWWPLRVVAEPKTPLPYQCWLMWHHQFFIPAVPKVAETRSIAMYAQK